MKTINISKAKNYMREAHEGQVRKYTHKPYSTHPEAVYRVLESIRADENILIAALLHDVVEDTDKTIEDITETFGKDVADLVAQVTDVSKKSDGKRSVRKEIDRIHLSKSTYEGATIKLADMIHNTLSITKHDPSFAQVYLHEKRLLLEVLKHGNKTLYTIASIMVEELS